MNGLMIDVGSAFNKCYVYDVNNHSVLLFDKVKFPDALADSNYCN